MKRKTFCLLLAAALPLLAGCSALLERSFGEVEPYADRYWDPGAEDTLRAENYQDLVNSLLMLVEQHMEEGTIRCYGEANTYFQARKAAREVRQETMLGAYLLEDLHFDYENNAAGGYGTLGCQMTYREDAEDMDAIMTLSDSQSLVDLLRLAVREGHDRLTVRFSYDMPRENVIAAVESMWQELCQDELDQAQAQDQPPAAETGAPEGEDPEGTDIPPEDGTEPETAEGTGEAAPPEDGGAASPPEDVPPAEGTQDPDGAPAGGPEDGTESAGEDGTEEPLPPEFPPCPWTVRFYPDMDTAELVEILLEDV